MNEGQARLVETLRNTLMLAEQNPCRAKDKTLMAMAKGMEAVLSSEVDMDLSREQAARYLGMSTRNLQRKVKEGVIPGPERHGHKKISFNALELVKRISKLKTLKAR